MRTFGNGKILERTKIDCLGNQEFTVTRICTAINGCVTDGRIRNTDYPDVERTVDIVIYGNDTISFTQRGDIRI